MIKNFRNEKRENGAEEVVGGQKRVGGEVRVGGEGTSENGKK